MTKENNVLTEDFLFELYYGCFTYDNVCAMVCAHMQKSYLPARDFQLLHGYLCKYYSEHKSAPTLNIISQIVAMNKEASMLIDDIKESATGVEADIILEQLEEYLRQVKFQKTYKEIGELYAKQDSAKAMKLLQSFSDWSNTFTLRPNKFVDVAETFESRFRRNKEIRNSQNSNKTKLVSRFYIDELDEKNGGRDLRCQLSCFLAASGIGKSHALRWIGKCACQIDGLDVLHIQLEGGEKETLDAYSASLVECSSYAYTTGALRDKELASMIQAVQSAAGTIKVKSYPKFANQISTIKIKEDVMEYKELYGKKPDVLLIDSMDLLTDSSGKQWTEAGERFKRVKVANDLKDLADEENIWVVVSYQATIENREWLNDEKNVLTEYNCAEAKGLCRPLSHLVTLNRSANEEREQTMRLYVAKSRFFPKGDPFKIATDYDHECFYDAVRTINLNKVML